MIKQPRVTKQAKSMTKHIHAKMYQFKSFQANPEKRNTNTAQNKMETEIILNNKEQSLPTIKIYSEQKCTDVVHGVGGV